MKYGSGNRKPEPVPEHLPRIETILGVCLDEVKIEGVKEMCEERKMVLGLDRYPPRNGKEICPKNLVIKISGIVLGDEKEIGEKDAKGTNPKPHPCANHISDGRVLADPVIERGVHTLNLNLTSLTKESLSSFVEISSREPHYTPSSSQKDKGFNIRVPLPKDSAQPHRKVSVASLHKSDKTKLVPETSVRYTEAQGLEHPESPLDPSAKTGSGPSLHDIDRTPVGSPIKGVRGSSASPREVNINTASEHSKATKDPCVGSSGSLNNYVIEGESKPLLRKCSTEVRKGRISKKENRHDKGVHVGVAKERCTKYDDVISFTNIIVKGFFHTNYKIIIL